MKENIKVLTTREMAYNLGISNVTLQRQLKKGEYKDMPRFELVNDEGIVMTRRFNSKAVINWLEKTFN